MINNMVMLATKGDNQILRFGLAHVRLGLVCIVILVVGVGFFTALPAKESYQAVAVSELAKQPKKLYDLATTRPAFTKSEAKANEIPLQQPSESVVPPPSPPVPAPAPKAASIPTPEPSSEPSSERSSEPSRTTTRTPAPSAPPTPAPVPAATYAPEPEPTPAPAPPEPYYEQAPASEPTYYEPVTPEEPATSTPSTPAEPLPEERNSPPVQNEDPSSDPSSGSCQPPACTIRVVGDGNSITPKTAPR